MRNNIPWNWLVRYESRFLVADPGFIRRLYVLCLGGQDIQMKKVFSVAI